MSDGDRALVVNGVPLPGLGAELQQAADELVEKEKKSKQKNKEIFLNQDLSQYAIKGSDSEWNKAIGRVFSFK